MRWSEPQPAEAGGVRTEFDGIEEMAPYEGKQLIANLEGPVTKNDYALGLCGRFMERGSRFFSVLSRYDDVMAGVVHRPNYDHGDVMRLLLPFLKGFGVSDNQMLEQARKSMVLVPGADKAVRFAQELMTSFLLSTTYEHNVIAVCEAIDFPLENAYSTKVSLDGVHTDDWEAASLRNYALEISSMPVVEIPEGASVLKDFTPRDQKTLDRLDEILWQELSDLGTYQLLLDVVPVGGSEKASALLDISKRTGVGLEDTLYFGSNITDGPSLQLVRRGSGMAIAFNGSASAVREAEVAVIADNAVVASVIAEAFHKGGRDGVLTVVDNWTPEGVKESGIVHDYLIRELERVFPEKLPPVTRVNLDNAKSIGEESTRFIKTVQGRGSAEFS
jgi:energy-converting hydrogenase A subunit R